MDRVLEALIADGIQQAPRGVVGLYTWIWGEVDRRMQRGDDLATLLPTVRTLVQMRLMWLETKQKCPVAVKVLAAFKPYLCGES